MAVILLIRSRINVAFGPVNWDMDVLSVDSWCSNCRMPV